MIVKKQTLQTNTPATQEDGFDAFLPIVLGVMAVVNFLVLLLLPWSGLSWLLAIQFGLWIFLIFRFVAMHRKRAAKTRALLSKIAGLAGNGAFRLIGTRTKSAARGVQRIAPPPEIDPSLN